MKAVVIYTDGACSGNPGPGGWGSILFYMDTQLELSGAEPNTTNNRMELTAAIEALSRLKQPCEVDLYSDSSYLINSFNQKWIFNWERNHWKRRQSDVPNTDLWKKLLELHGMHEIRWHWVRGHADNEHNNRCDELARNAIAQLKKDLKASL